MSSPAKALARRLLPHSVYRSYRRRKVASQIAAYEPHEVTHSYGGLELRVLLADPLGQGWYDHDWDEPTALTFLREEGVIAPGATVFDLGAHQAVIALMIAARVRPGGRVLAVEAEPHNAEVARRNVELNQAENVLVVHAAGAERSGTLSFGEGLNGSVDERASTGTVEVPAVTVDELAREHGEPALVMIDVEGYEARVLDGASETLGNGRTSFLVEVHEELADFGGSAEEVVARFAGFRRFVAVEDDDPLLPLDGAPPPGRFFLLALAPASA